MEFFLPNLGLLIFLLVSVSLFISFHLFSFATPAELIKLVDAVKELSDI